jgi:tocopherol cyclase
MNCARISLAGLISLNILLGCDASQRNGYMLHPDLGKRYGIRVNPLNTNGYDWWWHSLVARRRTTGELQPFFIEYFVINPGLGGKEPILGQSPENKAAGVRPSYAMIKAGTWAKDAAVQIHNFYGIDDFNAAVDRMDVRIGDNIANDSVLRGSVALSADEAASHPEYMSQSGEMSWDLSVTKDLSYAVGYAASEFLTTLNAFSMWWNIPGMKARYQGTITYNGEIFDVVPEQSYGYQDKNWGSEYTNPWVWLNCNNFTSERTGKALPMTSLDIGGGAPEAFGLPLGKKVLVVFYHEGKLYEFNFSKIWQLSQQRFDVEVGEKAITWNVVAQNGDSKLEIIFSNPKDRMLKVNYENPRGEWNHRELWNGGHASGTVKLFHRGTFGSWEWVDTFHGSLGGSEYGSYEPSPARGKQP